MFSRMEIQLRLMAKQTVNLQGDHKKCDETIFLISFKLFFRIFIGSKLCQPFNKEAGDL